MFGLIGILEKFDFISLISERLKGILLVLHRVSEVIILFAEQFQLSSQAFES